MEIIKATYRVVTPMFISGADQSKAELRLPSIKGALRFWWRALAWGRLNGDLGKIRQEENELFGSTDTGQAGVLMRLELLSELKILNVDETLKDNRHVVGEGARYLGYGVMEAFPSKNKGTQAGQLTRPCFLAPFGFCLSLLLKPFVSHHKQELLRSLKVLGLLGCIGSKARKGYGSLNLHSLVLKMDQKEENSWKNPTNPTEFLEAIRNLKLPKPTEEPVITAFSDRSRIILLPGNQQESSLSLLNRIGRDQVFYRSWGRNGKVFNDDSEKNFREDHDLMKQVASGRPAHTYPKRVAFGLPHNYGKSKDEQIEPSNTKLYTRRASPLFVHIHHAENSTPIAIVSFLPSQFLPEGETIRVGKNHFKPDETTLWRPIHGFLDRLKSSQQGKEMFGGAVEI